MELREKIVREAFAKKDVKPLLSHLRAIPLGSDEINTLVSLLKRGCLPLFEYPNAKAEAAREDAIAQIVAIIEARAPIGAADDIKAVLALFKLIESGYRAILEDLAELPSASLTPECRISALFDLCAQRRDGVRTASMDAIIVDGMIDPIGLGVADGHGNVVSPDVPIDVDVVTLTMALKMEAFQQGWFNASDQLVLPKRVKTTTDEREAVRPLLIAAQAWRHWTWIQEETRYFDGTLTDVPSSEFPQEYHDAGVTRFLHHVPGSAEWHVIDLAANERLHLRIKQEAAQMAFGTNAAKLVKGVSEKVPLLPYAFVSIEELQSAHTFDHALSISVATDNTQYRGLRLVEWLRGYATLQELVAAPYEAGDHRPELLLVELERADLVKRLQRVGLAGAKADSFINLVSFDKGTRDLFDTPILCCGSTTVLLYLPLHQWFDQSKAILADPRHRALRHHAEGIFMLEAIFGESLVNADGRVVPVRLVGEQHVREDLGSIPSFADWARLITPQAWMLRGNPLDGADGVTIDMPALGEAVASRSVPPAGGAVRTEI